jgi:hypothetical protein
VELGHLPFGRTPYPVDGGRVAGMSGVYIGAGDSFATKRTRMLTAANLLADVARYFRAGGFQGMPGLVELLRSCLYGKAERAAHFLLFSELERLGRYLVIPEYPIRNARDTADLLVADRSTGTPLAIVELKHYSAHQGDYAMEYLLRNKRGNSLDSDWWKRSRQAVHWCGRDYKISKPDGVPLIQIGIFTWVVSEPPASPHRVSFINTYMKVGKHGQLSQRKYEQAMRNVVDAEAAVSEWRNERSARYADTAIAAFRWGPDVLVAVPGTGLLTPIEGNIGSVCLLSR